MLRRTCSYSESLPDDCFRFIRLPAALLSSNGNTTRQVLDLKLEILPTRPPEPYKALSYTWNEGEGEDKCVRGRLNDEEHDIKSNLYKALCQLCSSHAGGLVWADALCINQGNKEEKSRLVQRMDEVYHNASEVIIWLGVSDEKTKDVLDAIAKVAAIVEKDSTTFASSIDLTRLDRLNELGLPDASDPIWKHYLDFYESRWFHRGWVVQEAVLARRAIAYCGDLSIDWIKIQRGSHIFNPAHLRRKFFGQFRVGDNHLPCRSLGRNAYRIGLLQDYFHRQDSSECLIMEIATGSRVPKHGEHVLLHLMRMARDFEWSDPRDRVYSMIGIVNRFIEELPFQVEADYEENNTAASVYTRFAQTIIETSSCIGIIALVSDFKRRSIANLPSWVPCFKNAPNFNNPKSHVFCADKNLRVLPECQSIYRFHGNTLEVFGVKVGTIEAVCGISLGKPSNICFMRKFARLASLPTGLGSDEILWRTLTSNSFRESGKWDKYPAEVSVVELYRSFVYDKRRDPVCIARQITQSVRANCVQAHDTFCHNCHSASPDELFPDWSVPTEEAYTKKALLYASHTEGITWEQQLFVLSSGHLGHGLVSSAPGDEMWVLAGCTYPMILRPSDGIPGFYDVVGRAYVHGLMGPDDAISPTTPCSSLILR